MKSIFTFLLVLILKLSYSQNYKVLDSITKEAIPFAAIKLNCNNGMYTNENGEFYLDKQKYDSIQISYLGYYVFKKNINKLNKIIYLIPKVEELKEIIISDKKPIVKTIGFLKKPSNLGWHIKSKHEFISFLKPNKTYEDSFIEKIHFPIKKSIFNDRLKNRIGVLRINIYSAKDNYPLEKLFSSSHIKYDINKKNEIVLDVSNQLITFKKEGICVGIEQIGTINKKGEIEADENNSLVLKFSSKKSKDFTSITYTNFIFSNDNKLMLVNDFIKKYTESKKEQNLVLGLTVSAYNN